MTENLIGLGRRVAEDPRDRNYMMQPVITARTYKNWYTPYPIYDQGNTAQCVAYSGVRFLTSSPVPNERKAKLFEADRGLFLDIYKECLSVDEWPGEDLENGTSIRALMKTLKRRGYITEYRWAYDVETVIQQVINHSPVVMGTDWYMNMFMPHNEHGYLDCSGEFAGGHAWVIVGANRQRENPDGTEGAVRMINSWGDGWGQRGKAWITFGDLAKLIAAQGEAAIAIEVIKQ